MPSVLLVIEDGQEALALSKRLKAGGFKVYRAGRLSEALEAAETHHLDAIAIDLSGRKLKGIEVFNHIREAFWLPILLMAGDAPSLDRLLQLDHCHTDFIAAPYTPTELASRLEDLIRMGGEASWSPSGSHIRYLFIDASRKKVFWKGVSLGLTVSEYGVLMGLLQANQRQISPQVLDRCVRAGSLKAHLEALVWKLTVTRGALRIKKVGGRGVCLRTPRVEAEIV
jgi:two-component system OmpR family response regulator